MDIWALIKSQPLYEQVLNHPYSRIVLDVYQSIDLEVMPWLEIVTAICTVNYLWHLYLK
jgi:hypothetical protein